MVFVVLRNGKVIQYNSGGAIAVEEGCMTVRGSKDSDGQRGLIARLPLDVVERAEFGRPCAILKAKAAPKRSNYESF